MKFLKRFVPMVLAVVLAFGAVTSSYQTVHATGNGTDFVLYLL